MAEWFPPQVKDHFNVFRNGTPLIKNPVSEKEAREKFEAIKKIFVANHWDICAKPDSFELFGVKYTIGFDNR